MPNQKPINLGTIKINAPDHKPYVMDLPSSAVTFTVGPSNNKNTSAKPIRPPFDASSVPYPTNHDITKSYGGHYHFMLAYNLKMYDDEDFEYSKQILEEIKKEEFENRVDRAREEYEKQG